MSDETENNRLKQSENRERSFGGLGLAVFFICVGLVYLMPNVFPEGTLYLVAGALILIVNFLNSFKGIGYDVLGILFAIGFIVIGVDKTLGLDIKFLPVIIIVLGVISLFANVSKLK